jgi:hypothetical protein
LTVGCRENVLCGGHAVRSPAALRLGLVGSVIVSPIGEKLVYVGWMKQQREKVVKSAI